MYLSKFIELFIKRKLTEFKLYLNKTSLEKNQPIKDEYDVTFIFVFSRQLVTLAI